MFVYFTIIEEPNFQEKVDELVKKYPRLAEVIRGVYFLLSKNPFLVGEKVFGEKNPSFVYRTVEFGFLSDIPQLDIIYEIDIQNSSVLLIFLRIVESMED